MRAAQGAGTDNIEAGEAALGDDGQIHSQWGRFFPTEEVYPEPAVPSIFKPWSQAPFNNLSSMQQIIFSNNYEMK